jgi:hypothetical protein
MKRGLVLVGLIAGLSGCSSVKQSSEIKPDAQMEPLLLSHASPTQVSQYERMVAELRTVSAALQKYAKDHNGQLPARLKNLVSQSYLPASALVSSADPSGGKEGGVPDSYSQWTQSSETDEPGSSYFYEFSEAPCKWDWKSYLGDSPSLADLDTNKDGVASWAEVKNWQLLHGDVVQKPKNWPYTVSRFPVVRCYWYQYPDAYTNATGRTVLNLAADLQTIFVSQPWWEKDAQ